MVRVPLVPLEHFDTHIYEVRHDGRIGCDAHDGNGAPCVCVGIVDGSGGVPILC